MYWYSFVFLIEQPVLAGCGVLEDLVPDEVYLYFMDVCVRICILILIVFVSYSYMYL